MNRGMLLALVNVLLVTGLALAGSDVVAQTSGPRLVTTQCGFGQLNVCGSETTAQQCTYVFGLTGDRSGAFGFNFGGLKCSGGTTQSRYKDFDSGTASGTCVILQRPPTDATRSRGAGGDELVDGGDGSDDGASC